MLERNRILISIILFLLILILLWICARFILRKLRTDCCDQEHEKKDGSEREIIHVDDKVQIDYSFEIVQPEIMEKATNYNSFDDDKYILYKKSKLKNRYLEGIMNSQIDSADEMSVIYDVNSDIESDQQRQIKNISARFAKYLDNVPSDEPVILVSLHYIKDEENMVLAIIKVANLKLLPNNRAPDPYVRVDVWIGKKIKLKKKTFFLKQEQNPIFNQKMEFHVSGKDLENVKIVLTIATYLFAQDGSLQHGVMPLHKLEIGEKSTGSCMEHWRTAITVNKPIAKWHDFY